MKPLTRRQREVIVLAANGYTNAGIARHLGIHRCTVDRHFAEAYASLGARDRANAVALAARYRQIDLDADIRVRGEAWAADTPPEVVCASVSAELPARAAPSARDAAKPSDGRTAA